MTYTILAALVAFAFATSITPGPNNLMVLASGANFGIRRTVPHMLGISVGFMVMVIAVGLGVIALFELYPFSYTVLKVFSVAYLLYLAWKIATAADPVARGTAAEPMSFLAAALFQWVNPKAWSMALTAITVYAPDRSLGSVAFVGAVFALVNLPSISGWAWLGQAASRILTSTARLRFFNRTMAVLLVASLYPVLSMPG